MNVPSGPRRGRRHRRIAWTAGIVVTAAAAVGLVTWKLERDRRETEYTPGEVSADVTSKIADNAPRAIAAARVELPGGASESLRDAGRKLPAGAPLPRFADVTRAAGLDSFVSFAGTRSSQLPEDMGGGVAWGDFDNDGHEDLFVVAAGGALHVAADQRAESMLFRNRGDGTFERAPFPEVRIIGMGAAWADYDGDGWLDLAVSGFDALLLFRNEKGRFVQDRRFASPKGFWTGISWGDFNRDGRPDLYVCGYVRYVVKADRTGLLTQQFGLEVPYTLNPASFDAERNLLFRNEGAGAFREVAKSMGVDNPDGRSLSALWHDFDQDGWPDLYVANDISENKFFLNQQGRFVEAGPSSWVAEYRGSMGLAASDFDRDGDDDLFISHWIAQGFALYQSLFTENREAGLGRGEKNGQLRFTDVAEMAGVGQPSLQKIGWGASFADFDSDGWTDLVVANGSTFEAKDGSRKLIPMESFLFWNNGKSYFHDLAPWNVALSEARVSRGLAIADYDNDGAVDIAIVDLDGGVRLLRNEVPQGNWIALRLRNRLSGGLSGFADGATVTVLVGGKPVRRAVSSASYLSQDSRSLHIGLGSATAVDRLEVRWHHGAVQTFENVAANRIWEVAEGRDALRPLSGRERVLEFWTKQRAAMDAMKREKDVGKAASLFEQALAIDAAHEDSRYYLANCRIAQGDIAGALTQLDELARINPLSHRAWQRRGVVLAATGRFQEAGASLKRALRINPEETGTTLLLAEVALASGDLAEAGRRLDHALSTNSRSVGGLFLRGYIEWRKGSRTEAEGLLQAAGAARGPEWKPAGSAAEGDVRRRMFAEAGFLAPYWEQWDGSCDAPKAYAAMHAWLSSKR